MSSGPDDDGLFYLKPTDSPEAALMRRKTALTSVEQWYARIAAQPFRGAWQGIAAITPVRALVP